MGAAIEVKEVSKRFKLRKQRFQTLKERVIFLRRARAFEEFWALKEVTFDVPSGTTFGLIGANGSGKTTLLRLIAGIFRPTEGEIRINGRVAALLELGAGFHPDLTGRENIYLNASILGTPKKEVDRHFDSIVQFAELDAFIDNPVRNYSSGMYVRLGFSVAVHMDPDILLVDEVLAVGDEAFQEKCLTKIREFQKEGRTILVVTHGLDVVRDMCHQAAYLHHGELTAFGHPTEVIRTYRDKVATTPSGEKVTIDHLLDFIGIRILDKHGRAADVFPAGESMTVEVELKAQTFVPDPVFSLNIHDGTGLHIFGTNTHWRFMQVDLDSGPARLKIEFPVLPMKDGRYTVTVGVHSRDGLTLYAPTDISAKFEMRGGSDELGRLLLPCTFSVEGAAVRREGS